MKNIQTVINTKVPISGGNIDFAPVSFSFAGKHKLHTQDSSIRIARPVSAVWKTLTGVDFWKHFFSYTEFQGSLSAFSEFFASGIRDGRPFQEHGEFTAFRPGLLIQYHVWHWGHSPEEDTDSGVTILFRDAGLGSTRISVMQTWRLLDGDANPSFDWNIRLERLRDLLENISR